MQAEIVTIGTELLLGQIIDTNATYLAQQLGLVGLNVHRKTTVGDNELQIADAVRSALRRSDIVITTGGLGPTVNDQTREAVAAATNRKLVLNQNLLQNIEAFFRRRGYEMGENSRRQAYVPRSAIPIHNPVGTAPGFIVKHQDNYVISLPGIPRELRQMTEHSVLPFLRRELGLRSIIKSRTLRTAGYGESDIDRLITDLEESTNPTVMLVAHPGSVDIRITAKATDDRNAQQMLDKLEAQVRERLGDLVYGVGDVSIEDVVVGMLAERGWRVAMLETNTGGVLASRMTATPHGIEVLNQALVTSLDQAQTWFLSGHKDKPEISAQVAEILATKIRERAEVDVSMAIVGDVSPDAGPNSEHTGDTFIGMNTAGAITHEHIRVGGVSEIARAWIINAALNMLRKCLLHPSN